MGMSVDNVGDNDLIGPEVQFRGRSHYPELSNGFWVTHGAGQSMAHGPKDCVIALGSQLKKKTDNLIWYFNLVFGTECEFNPAPLM